MEEMLMKTLYFITGSQDLYGEETLAQAAKDSKEMAAYLNEQLCGIAGVVFQRSAGYLHKGIVRQGLRGSYNVDAHLFSCKNVDKCA